LYHKCYVEGCRKGVTLIRRDSSNEKRRNKMQRYKNGFDEVFKNLARFEKNFVRLSK